MVLISRRLIKRAAYIVCSVAPLLACQSDGTAPPAPPAATPPTISAQPQSVTVNAGQPASFGVTAIGTAPLVYQWRRNASPLADARGATLTINSAMPADAAAYDVVVSNPAGSVASTVAVLGVTVAPSVTAHPQNISVVVGQPAAFSVSASGTAPFSYQWRRNALQLPGANAAMLAIAAAAASDAASYDVVVTNAAGSVTSNAATLAVTPAAPLISVQPADTTISVNRTAKFAVVASGSETSYQWMRNGVDIAGANAPSYETPSLSLGDSQTLYSVSVRNHGGVIVSRSARVTVLSLAPVLTPYTDFGGRALMLYAWEGAATVVLSQSDALATGVMAAILAATDKSYEYYRAATGYTPGPGRTYNGKPTVADVVVTCGAGCGFVAANGIELQHVWFDRLYTFVRTSNQFDQVVFYEFGRNFWSLGSRLDYKGPENAANIAAGFAVFMRFMAMEAAGVQGAPFNAWSFADFRTRVESMVDLYLADPAPQTWQNTLALGRAQANNPSGLGSTDLLASFLFRLRRDYGGNAFIERIWKEAALRPLANSTQDAVDNFVLAACTAAGKNMAPLFLTMWRWPVSASAQATCTAFPASARTTSR